MAKILDSNHNLNKVMGIFSLEPRFQSPRLPVSFKSIFKEKVNFSSIRLQFRKRNRIFSSFDESNDNHADEFSHSDEFSSNGRDNSSESNSKNYKNVEKNIFSTVNNSHVFSENGGAYSEKKVDISSSGESDDDSDGLKSNGAVSVDRVKSVSKVKRKKKPNKILSSDKEIVMPPRGLQEFILEDVSEFDVDSLIVADAVYNKELSWLSFNWRVLQMALDSQTPLFERLRFLAITSRNLDEFFCKRVGALKRQEAVGLENLILDVRHLMWTPRQQLKIVAQEVSAMVKTQMECLNNIVIPELRNEGIHLLKWKDTNDEQQAYLSSYFKSSLEPLLTPLAVDPGHPFPFISNMAVSIAVQLRDPLDDSLEFAIINIPSCVSRWKSLALNPNFAHLRNHFISTEDLIKENLHHLFGGMEIICAHFFRVTRNADVTRNEDEAEDLLEMINDEMRERKFAPFVRLEVESDMPDSMLKKLTSELLLNNHDDVYRISGYLALGEIDSIPVKLEINSTLTFEQWAPKTHPRLQEGGGIFEIIKAGDLLVHHPYHSFRTSTQLFFESAASDPKVRAIKATLYRTSSDSPVISALARAAEAGKEVSVLVELKARFDEARNVGFAKMLEDSGCNVAYGLVGLKTHCKCTLVVREEEDGLRTYVHIGTGNYNPRTASVYTDLGLFSCKADIGADVIDLFKYLTGYHRQSYYRRLLVAPGTLRRELVRLIEKEISNVKLGLKASLIVKCNGLDDQVVVSKLYEASRAGVKIDLIVRGMCRIRPGIPGLSENIRVVSIIGRFLEHHRIMRFENGGDPLFFIGSADWMTRNLMRRVEVITPIDDPSLCKELQMILDACLYDRRQAWELRSDARYHLLKPDKTKTTALTNPAKVKSGSVDSIDPASRAQVLGLHQTFMDTVSSQCKKARKVSLKKMDGSTVEPR